MQWDAITDQWPWFAAAAVLVVLVVAFVAYGFYKPKPQPGDPIQNQQDGWTPTGRIDFIDRQSGGDFVLQVEDTRIADSASGVEHREIRWRKATLDEAKRVIVAYHAQRNLARTANFIVTSPSVARRPDLQMEQSENQVGKDEAADGKSEG
ncbi:MAG: hypothetical protein WBF03_08295 [Xanthobacteraceae bacterium]